MHQNISINADTESLGHACEGFEKGVAIAVGIEDGLLFITPRENMIVSAFILNSEGPCHDSSLIQALIYVNYKSIVKV